MLIIDDWLFTGMMYYYKRKSNPFKWVIIIFVFMALGAMVYWFYFNYFSKIDLSGSKTNEEVNSNSLAAEKIIGGEISLIQEDVQVNIGEKGYEKAIDQAILHQGDKIKTGENSLAVLKLEDDTKIRLAANSEIFLKSLSEGQVIIEQISGRSYNNIAKDGNYQINFLNTKITALGTKFEVISNKDQESLAVFVFENKVNLEILNQDEIVLASRLDLNEKCLVNLQAAKKDMLKIENFDVKLLTKESWYQWNFDQDKGVSDQLPELEPDFEEVFDTLQIKAEQKDAGISLTWSAYTKDNFKSFKIVRSKNNIALKYPEDAAIKTSTNQDLASYIDQETDFGQLYYYRICVVKSSDKVVCGNVVSIETKEKDSTPPNSPILSGEVSVYGVNLTWSANTEADFKEYRLIKSITEPEPKYPSIGYLAIKSKGVENYLDKEVNITSPGNVYYRVCALDLTGNSSCSNTVWVENGVKR
ncbi:MAG: FecR family protein [Candidatus Parcubacteria bacterium]|nr:FecR family protein [Candidatus Parcubacteria bacterium]